MDPPLGNGTFTWSNFEENSVCNRLDRFIFFVECEDCYLGMRRDSFESCL